jgi:hypothetical protein
MPPSPSSPTRDSTSSSPKTRSHSTTPSSYFTFPVSYAVGGILRRLSADQNPSKQSPRGTSNRDMDRVYTPPIRRASPFQPPPLTPLSLSGWRSSTKDNAKLLKNALAEEIRLLVPARLQLEEEWKLLFSLEQDGVSLTTLYEKCEGFRGKRGGYVLVVRDGLGCVSSSSLYDMASCSWTRADSKLGQIFGAYLSDPPHPGAHFYGTGECFLWRAHILPSMPDLASLPPPPSADTTNAQRQTTLLHPRSPRSTPNNSNGTSRSGTSTPDRIRFKAFPYSGINDYMIFCEQGYLSVGGG